MLSADAANRRTNPSATGRTSQSDPPRQKPGEVTSSGLALIRLPSNGILKSPFSPRLLKKVQMQGGAPGTHPPDGCRCEAYLVRTSQRRASVGEPTAGGSPQMGLFQQPARFR